MAVHDANENFVQVDRLRDVLGTGVIKLLTRGGWATRIVGSSGCVTLTFR